MVDAGTALIVMGNHEYNAIAWATLRPDGTDHLRTRLGSKGAKNRKQHAAFLEAVGEDTALHDEWVDWFRTMPLWLDLDGLRVVHACWHEPSMDVLRPFAVRDDGSWCLDDGAMVATSNKDLEAYAALECLLKGPEVRLPNGLAYLDKELHRRDKARIAWWLPDTSTYRLAALIPSRSTTPDGDDFPELPDTVVSDGDTSIWPVPSYRDDVPVVVGHYWSTRDDQIRDARMVCVDLSAAKDLNPLAAYRWSGETAIDGANLVWVDKSAP
ncbi:MAG: metallophosphoesterase [Actinobacteria bacterium]|nr:metallophosphoesterase [Actinomycetota bacterium]